jgi:murein L,D-transpeptidase YcbB/YkuD
MSQIVFSPYWNVPLICERDSAAIAKNHNYLVKMTWNGWVRVRQDRTTNALGKVKFIFKFHIIFMHALPKSIWEQGLLAMVAYLEKGSSLLRF